MSARHSRGFTLLEVIVAIVVFATVMSLLIQLVTQNLRRTADARDDLRAARLAEGKLREILFQAEKGELPEPGANQGSFEGDDEDMAFEIKVDSYGIPLPQGAAKQVVQGSGLFAGGGTPAVRMVTVKVFPASSDPELINPVPFVAFVAEPNPPAEPAPGEGESQDEGQGEQTEEQQLGEGQPGIDDSSQEFVDQ